LSPFFEKIVEDPEPFKVHSFVFEEFKVTRQSCHLYYLYFVGRRMMIAFVVVFLKSNPRLQL
jgi:hypothetical protein